MRRFFFKLHLWSSIIASPFILVFAVTGCFMAFEPELDHLLHARLSYVEPKGKQLSLGAISDAIHKAYPLDTIGSYDIATSPGISYKAYTNNQTIYIDQYSGKILGTMTEPDFWENTQNIIHQLHLRLAFHDKHNIGKSIMTWAGVCMLIILPAGLVLWWKQKQLSIRSGSNSRQFWFDLHSMTGAFVFIFLLVPVVTGVIIGFEHQTVPLMYKLTSSRPTPMPDIKIISQPGKKQITPDSALQAARNALPGVTPFNINVAGPADAYFIRCRYPEDLTPGGRSMVIIDPYTAKVLYAEGSRTAPAGTRLKVATRAIHTGDIFGIPSKFFGLLVCLVLVVQIVSGLKMWLGRKLKKGAASTKIRQ
ncbi:PepSY-associated TM helix domain-containing protein [Mucilaginibacter ginsenosidivorans]|uniref:PepSY domain-containing protein n=1 Tax=Mucilaginibacter ginsenosidivorans TaxID=398053 RepID=A0A5B8UZD7_9SPHI|nr:PepSY-associated TM helix domain-containing protein [Mucilaginibacter ginsenosidivorans]QEC63943.1 PepSY domain-containing protein [Mucilaginibacter ginsenosidivorans]